MSNVAVLDNYRHLTIQERRVSENASMGYIRLCRSIRKSSFGRDVYKRVLWENLLMKACHKPKVVNFNSRYWELDTGQLVCLVEALGAELCDPKGKPLDRSSVNRILKFFEHESMITRSGNRFGTVISITNYAHYNAIFGEHISEHIPEQSGEQLSEQLSEQLNVNNAKALGAGGEQLSEQLDEQLGEQSNEHRSEHRTINNKQTLNNTNTPLPSKSPKLVKRATQLPNNFSSTGKHETLAMELGVNLQKELEAFIDYHTSKGSTFKDWNAALNTWLRNAAKFSAKFSSPKRNVSQPAKPMADIPEGFIG